MKGFFDGNQYKTKEGRKIKSCASCGLLTENPLRQPQGEGGKGILIIVDRLTHTAHSKGNFLADKHGRFLTKILSDLGIIVEQDVWLMSAHACPSHTQVSNLQYDCCNKNLKKQIKEIKPKVICSLGNYATKFFIAEGNVENMKTVEGITQIHGKPRILNFQGLKIKLIPLFHPAAIIYNRSLLGLWEKDMEIVKLEIKN